MTRFAPAPLRGELRPPPDKSISHRAALIGAMVLSGSVAVAIRHVNGGTRVSDPRPI